MTESDLSFISDEFIRSALFETGEKCLNTKEFRINLNSASKPGDSFLGIVHRVTYEKCNNNQQQIRDNFDLILKLAPTHPARRATFGTRNFFIREIYLYDELLPYFEEFQLGKGIDQNGFNEFAKCYRSLDIEPNECLLLEDLTTSGFKMIDRHNEKITADHVNLVMQTLGKFHAISFALQDQKPEKFKEIISHLEEIFIYDGQEQLIEYFKVLQKIAMEAIPGIKDTDVAHKAEKIFKENFFQIASNCVKGELAEPYAVVCHGDCWSNNSLFKYDINGNPIEVRLIDWQLTRYASPVTDILYYLFGSVEKDLRDSHYNVFLNNYHDSLSNHLKRLGSDPERLFPYKSMIDHFHKFGKLALVAGAMFIRDMISTEDTAFDVNEVSEQWMKLKKWNENDVISDSLRCLYIEKIKDLIYDLVHLNYI